jgi:hypothetical protein
MKHLFIITILSAILIGSIVYLMGKQPTTPSSIIETQMTATPSSTEESFIPSPPDTSFLKQGGNSYTESKGLYTFLYPNDYKLDSQGDQLIRISKTGSTQRGQTEMYDGVIVVFESVNLEGQTLEKWVDGRIAQSTADSTTTITQPKKVTHLQAYPGFTYTARGLGESTYLIVQKDAKSNYAVSITFLVADPQKKDYQKEVDTILSTLEFHK